MGRREPVFGYPSKKDAAIGFAASGLAVEAIAERLGSTAGNVRFWIRNGVPVTAWTAERRSKARRLFARTIRLIAEAMAVTPHALCSDGLKGVVAPLGRTAEGVHALLQSMAYEGIEVPAGPFPEGEAQELAPIEAEDAADDGDDEPDADFNGDDSAVLTLDGWAGDGDDVTAEAVDKVRARAADALAGADLERVDGIDIVVERKTSSPPPDQVRGFGGQEADRSGSRYALKNANGEFLHEHEGGFTRLPRFIWRGTADELAALKAAKPQYADLAEVWPS